MNAINAVLFTAAVVHAVHLNTHAAVLMTGIQGFAPDLFSSNWVDITLAS